MLTSIQYLYPTSPDVTPDAIIFAALAQVNPGHCRFLSETVNEKHCTNAYIILLVRPNCVYYQ